MLKPKTVIYLIGLTELAIGLITISGLIISALFLFSKKPVNVFIFVLASAVISTFLGFGLLLANNWARRLLIFFSGWVVLTKILVFMNILQFSGELLIVIKNPVKNAISILYHVAIIILLNQEQLKKGFLPEKNKVPHA